MIIRQRPSTSGARTTQQPKLAYSTRSRRALRATAGLSHVERAASGLTRFAPAKFTHPVFFEQETSHPGLAYQTRQFINPEIVVTSVGQLLPYVEQISTRLSNGSIQTPEQMVEVFLDYNDLVEVFSRQYFAARFKKDGNTTDPDFKTHYKSLADIKSALAPEFLKLEKLFLDHPVFQGIQDPRFQVLKQRWQQKQAFLPSEDKIAEYTRIQTAIADLVQRYNSITGSFEVEIDGEALLMSQAATLLQTSDEAQARKVWFAIQQVWKNHEAELNDIFDQLLAERVKLAALYGKPSMKDVVYDGGSAVGFYMDYTAEDAAAFSDAAKTVLSDLADKLDAEHAASIGVDQAGYKPWMKNMIPEGEEPLVPFSDYTDFQDKLAAVLEAVDPEMAVIFKEMVAQERIDFPIRKGKRTGGWMEDVPGELPYILMNGKEPGNMATLVTLTHEMGHAASFMAASHVPFLFRMIFTMEMAEVPSKAMELIGSLHWDQVYDDPKQALHAKKQSILRILRGDRGMKYLSFVDSFQNWVYDNPGHTQEQRHAKVLELLEEYGLVSDETREFAAQQWQGLGHIYRYPYYALQYAFASLGALQVFKNVVESYDPEVELQKFINGFHQIGTATSQEIFAAMGIEFDFSKDKIQELVAFAETYLESLDQELAALES